MPKTSLSSGSTVDLQINSLLSTFQWGDTNGNAVSITYSFADEGSTWVTDYANAEPFSPNSYSSLNNTQRQDFREALATWSDVANVTFQETDDTVNQGDFRIAFSTVVGTNTAGYSYGAPEFTSQEYTNQFNNGASIYASLGDIWLNTADQDYSQDYQSGFATLVHEIGHSLGLKHPFNVDPENATILPGTEDSVYSRMKKLYPMATGPLIVHRLDMSTSGLMVIALTKKSHKILQQQFIKRTVKKRYVAVLDGLLIEDEGIIELPLRVDLDDRPRQLVCYDYGRPAKTRWQVLERYLGETKVYFYPITGRTHQLRIHSAHIGGIGLPIKGDDLYGNGSDRLHLHAEKLEIEHPATKLRMVFQVEATF